MTDPNQVGRGLSRFVLFFGQFVAGKLAAKGIKVGLSKFSQIAAQSGGETFYRAMSPSDYEILRATGRMPATTETFISPTQAFANQYRGILVKFTMREGTLERLVSIGVRDVSKLTRRMYPGMPLIQKGWNAVNAYFKGEGAQINIGLGKGTALDLFNDNIWRYDVIRK